MDRTCEVRSSWCGVVCCGKSERSQSPSSDEYGNNKAIPMYHLISNGLLLISYPCHPQLISCLTVLHFGWTRIFAWNCYQIQLFSCLAFRGMLDVAVCVFIVNIRCVERLFSRENRFYGDIDRCSSLFSAFDKCEPKLAKRIDIFCVFVIPYLPFFFLLSRL